jgi:DNA-directed RNA polymerase subunit RPC12/RpoP
MILSDYRCESCQHEFEDVRIQEERRFSFCPLCNNKATQLLGTRHKYRNFVEGWWEHIADQPIYIHNRRHLREVCRQHDCYARLDDGYLGV